MEGASSTPTNRSGCTHEKSPSSQTPRGPSAERRVAVRSADVGRRAAHADAGGPDLLHDDPARTDDQDAAVVGVGHRDAVLEQVGVVGLVEVAARRASGLRRDGRSSITLAAARVADLLTIVSWSAPRSRWRRGAVPGEEGVVGEVGATAAGAGRRRTGRDDHRIRLPVHRAPVGGCCPGPRASSSRRNRATPGSPAVPNFMLGRSTGRLWSGPCHFPPTSQPVSPTAAIAAPATGAMRCPATSARWEPDRRRRRQRCRPPRSSHPQRRGRR